jgi:hypothetical protein
MWSYASVSGRVSGKFFLSSSGSTTIGSSHWPRQRTALGLSGFLTAYARSVGAFGLYLVPFE